MTDIEIFDFCEQHNIEVSFMVDKETSGRHLRIRRGAWQYAMNITPEQIEGAKAWSSIIKETLHHMVAKLDQKENARKAELEAYHARRKTEP